MDGIAKAQHVAADVARQFPDILLTNGRAALVERLWRVRVVNRGQRGGFRLIKKRREVDVSVRIHLLYG